MRAELETADGARKEIVVAPVPPQSIFAAIKNKDGKVEGFRMYQLVGTEVIAIYRENASDAWGSIEKKEE